MLYGHCILIYENYCYCHLFDILSVLYIPLYRCIVYKVLVMYLFILNSFGLRMWGCKLTPNGWKVYVLILHLIFFGLSFWEAATITFKAIMCNLLWTDISLRVYVHHFFFFFFEIRDINFIEVKNYKRMALHRLAVRNRPRKQCTIRHTQMTREWNKS